MPRHSSWLRCSRKLRKGQFLYEPVVKFAEVVSLFARRAMALSLLVVWQPLIRLAAFALEMIGFK